jgi:hypothetical protein
MPGPVPDAYGLAARSPDGVIPPGTLVRRNPGEEEDCAACLASPAGLCKDHPEFYVIPAPAAQPEEAREPAGGLEDAPEPDGLPGRDWRVSVR